jgi:hypothetical protein
MVKTLYLNSNRLPIHVNDRNGAFEFYVTRNHEVTWSKLPNSTNVHVNKNGVLNKVGNIAMLKENFHRARNAARPPPTRTPMNNPCGMRAFLQGKEGICYMMSTINSFMLHPQGRVIMFNALKDYMIRNVTTHSAKVSFITKTNTCPVGHRKFEFFKALYFAFKDAQNSSGRSSRAAYNLMKNLAKSVRTRPNIGGLTPTVLPEIMNRLNIKCNIYDAITNRPTRKEKKNPDIIIYIIRLPPDSSYLPDEVDEYEDNYRLGSASFGFDLPGNNKGGHEMAGVHCGDNSWYVVDSARSAHPIQKCDWWRKSTLVRHIKEQSGYPAATNIGFSYFVYYKNSIPTTYNTSAINRMLSGVSSMNGSMAPVVGTARAIAPSSAIQMRGRARKNATTNRKNNSK